MNQIKLGYEIDEKRKADEVNIPLGHLVVTGITNLSGKTTTLEALIKRSGLRAIVFRTKIGEKSFLAGRMIQPYFKDRSDWQYIKALFEAIMNQKVRNDEQAYIIKTCKKSGDKSLFNFKKIIDERLLEKIPMYEENILTNLQAYLDIVLPKIQSIHFSKTLEVSEGLNIIDLERFSGEDAVQSLIISSVLEEVLYNPALNDVVVVIPEAWKFVPQGRGNPCKRMIESYIRQGATNKNFIWIDSQDIAGVDKTPLKQISVWILGYQSETNEVKHTIDQLPIPKKSKPNPDQIMTLQKGEFYLATRDFVKKLYVQPYWLDDIRAQKIARGELSVKDLDAPQPSPIQPIPIQTFEKEDMISENKIYDIVNEIFSKTIDPKFRQFENDIDQIKHQIQDTPTQTIKPIDEEKLIKTILSRIPSSEAKVYTLEPLEKIRQDFLLESKNKILADVQTLTDNAKRMMKYLESKQKGIKGNELLSKCFFWNNDGDRYKQLREIGQELISKEFVRYDNRVQTYYGTLQKHLESLLINHNATPEEVKNVYDHILYEMLGGSSQ